MFSVMKQLIILVFFSGSHSSSESVASSFIWESSVLVLLGVFFYSSSAFELSEVSSAFWASFACFSSSALFEITSASSLAIALFWSSSASSSELLETCESGGSSELCNGKYMFYSDGFLHQSCIPFSSMPLFSNLSS